MSSNLSGVSFPCHIVLIESMVAGVPQQTPWGNRATGVRSQTTADNDVDAVKVWLGHFLDTKTTFANYRKEAERHLL